jgi:hypothetical protein
MGKLICSYCAVQHAAKNYGDMTKSAKEKSCGATRQGLRWIMEIVHPVKIKYIASAGIL